MAAAKIFPESHFQPAILFDMIPLFGRQVADRGMGKRRFG